LGEERDGGDGNDHRGSGRNNSVNGVRPRMLPVEFNE
jgi:hypothetical protein